MVVRLHQVTQGFDFNFFQKTTVSWGAYGGGAPDGYSSDLLIPFSTYGIQILNETSGSTVRVSFNGISDHDELIQSALPQGITYLNRVVCGIWFKAVVGTPVVSVRAWAIR